MQAIGYIRAANPEQRKAVKSYCDRGKLDLVKVLADKPTSGRVDKRPSLRAAVLLTCKLRAVLVLFSVCDARSIRNLIDITERIRAAGAQLASVAESIDTRAGMGEFYFGLMAALGKLERERTAERSNRVVASKRRKGERVGRVPFGYDLGADGVKLIASETEQATIKLIRKLRDDGYAYKELAARLNRDGIATKTGAKWSPKVVWSLCKSA